MVGMCRLSCRLEMLPGARVGAQLENAAAFGFDAVAVPGRYLERYVAGLRDCLPDSPVPLSSLSLGFEGSLVSPDARIREKCRESLLRLFDLCAELKIGRVNMPPVLIEDNPLRIQDAGEFSSVEERQDALLVEQLPEIGCAAKEHGVALLVEPVNRYESDYMNTVGHAARICNRVGHAGIGLTVDFFHTQMEELDAPSAIADAGRWVKLVHVAENTRVEPGPGSLDFVPGFGSLKKISYGGFIEVECRALSGPAEDVLPRCVERLRMAWQEA